MCLLCDVFDRQRVRLRLKAPMLRLDRFFRIIQSHCHIFNFILLNAVNGRNFFQVCGLAFLSCSWLICCLIQLFRVLSGLFLALLTGRPVHTLVCRRLIFIFRQATLNNITELTFRSNHYFQYFLLDFELNLLFC